MKIIKLDNVEQEFIKEYSMKPFVIPTETVYGLAGRIDNDDVLKSIFKLKGRPSDNPLIIHISSFKMLNSLMEGELHKKYSLLINHFWPGPLSIIVKAKKNISKLIYGNTPRLIAVRMPDSPSLLNLINIIGVPLAAPSANKSGRPSPTNINHVIDDFGTELDVYIDGGPTKIGIESTVINIIDDKIVILRPGGITKEQLEEFLNENVEVKNNIIADEKIMCPGIKYKHYSPRIPVYLFKGKQRYENMEKFFKKVNNKKIGFIGTEDEKNNLSVFKFYNLGNSKKEIAKNLFNNLINAEKECDLICISEIDLDNEGLALMDRITKASSYII